MQDQLSPVWKEIEKYISEGLSLIPIREKDEVLASGKIKKKKSPYGESWTPSQSVAFTMPQIWELLEKYNTTAIGIVCGTVSGNLEAIDIDVKYQAGIDVRLFHDLKEFYSDILNKCRIQKTPSGGFHIIYRCEEAPGGNIKLAGRAATPAELKADPQTKKYYFLETRGQGGYIAGSPSLGYKVVKDNPLPILTKLERDTLINVCKSYTELLVQTKEYKPTASDNSIYDESPFEDFNKRADGVQVAIDLGWTLLNSTPEYFRFSRPGSTKGNVHMSWMVDRRMYKVFTTKTDLEGEKSYSPAIFLSVLKFGDDRKLTYKYLVDNGFGKVKGKVEEREVKKAAINGGVVQSNFSDKAKQQLADEKVHMASVHPYGIFWEQDDEGKIIISRERLYAVADGLGFRLYRGEVVRILEPFIHNQTERQFFDVMKEYINEEDGSLYEDICNSYESFLQKSGSFTVGRLPIMDETLIAKDTRQYCQKFFINGYLQITSQGATFKEYKELGKLVFAARVQARIWKEGNGGLYVDYLQKAIATQSNLQRVIGYLSHEYKDASLGYIVILTEQVPDPRLGGGSGKNLFGHLLKGTTSVTGKAASQTKMDDKIFQIWKGEKIFTINDLPPNFDIVYFKDISTDGFVLKILYKNEVVIEGSEAFKLLLSTNFSYEVSDGGLRRRIIPIEFTPFFTNAGGVRKHYGKLFPQAGLPDDWTIEDWAGYDNYIAECIVEWFRCGMELLPETLSDTGWEKQFIQNFGQTAYDFIEKNWRLWLAHSFVPAEEFKKQLDLFYEEEGTTNDRYKISPRKVNDALMQWAIKHQFEFKKDATKRNEIGIVVKGKSFVDLNPPNF